MTATLVGSRALIKWFPDAREPRENSDWDWFCSNDHEIVPGGTVLYGTPHFDDARHDWFRDSRLAEYPWGELATPDELYTIKISHSYWEINSPGNWDKHANDIIFLRRKGAKFIRPLHDLLVPIWKEKHDKRKRVSLNKTGKEFFRDAVVRKYDHDSLHETVAYHDRPLFERFLKDGEEVLSDWGKFCALGHDLRIQAVREEIYATALERILIPGNYTGSPRAAYHWALRRTATSLLKNKWATYLMLNLTELIKPDCDYMQRHLANTDRLRPYEGE